MNLKDKIVVITGASRGLGEELAKTFSGHKAKVTVSARDEEDLKRVANETGADYIVTDVTDEKDVTNLADEVTKKYGQIDIWVNNAGIWLKHSPIVELDMKRFHEVMEVNLFGTVYGSKVALAQMEKQGNGSIVNIISTSALEGRLGSSGYCASKFAVDGFTKSLRLEANQSGIKTIAVYPGGMKTHLFDEQKPDGMESYMQPADIAEKIVTNLEQGTPEEEQILKRPTA